ncbi:MAG: CHAP domain-containing protein [Nocardioidaceae bacterium]|nr:MAG: CHAP domain-containing protein [Nocardioidaceae bacterium]
MRTLNFAALAVVIAVAAVLLGPLRAADAKPGTDDYPAKLKNARQDALVDPWLFYNRQCTSFVAWRLNNDNGVDFDNYYGGIRWSNASNWKNAATKVGVKVDNVPVVGAVAWWAAGTPGSSRGHVAWVMDVTSNGIVIEEYNWAKVGGYGTRTLAKNDSKYPSGFIHVSDLAIANVNKPTLAGTAQVGAKLTAGTGTWTPGDATISYKWAANGKLIPGATKKTFTLTADQLGQTVRARVIASKPGLDNVVAKTPLTAAVQPGVFKTTATPTISGTPQVGQTLTASTGTWSPAGSYSYQWRAAGKEIAGATEAGYSPMAGDVGKKLTVRVTSTLAGYTSATSTSTATAAVKEGAFERETGPAITGTAQVGQVLTASPGTWTPPGAYAYQWYLGNVAIAGATKATYTPKPADIGKRIKVSVTVTAAGYTSVAETSVRTTAVVPGVLTQVTAPAITGTAQIGHTLTATAGTWSPKATTTLQWLVDGVAVKNATGATFSPRPADVGKQISLRVQASRDGYTTRAVTSPATAAVRLGVIENLAEPTLSGKPVVGKRLQANPGRWSVASAEIKYQWFLGGKPVAGATASSYIPTKAERVRVRVTISKPGYQTTKAKAGMRIFKGELRFETRPKLTGRAQVYKLLRVHPDNIPGRGERIKVRWLRDGKPIPHAHRLVYRVRVADEGHRIRAEVTARRKGWIPTVRYSRLTVPTRPAV